MLSPRIGSMAAIANSAQTAHGHMQDHEGHVRAVEADLEYWRTKRLEPRLGARRLRRVFSHRQAAPRQHAYGADRTPRARPARVPAPAGRSYARAHRQGRADDATARAPARFPRRARRVERRPHRRAGPRAPTAGARKSWRGSSPSTVSWVPPRP